MNNDEVTAIISNIINIKDDYDTFFWVGTDGTMLAGSGANIAQLVKQYLPGVLQ